MFTAGLLKKLGICTFVLALSLGTGFASIEDAPKQQGIKKHYNKLLDKADKVQGDQLDDQEAQRFADPLSHYNHNAYRATKTLDDAIIKPIAEGYKFITPQFVRTGVSNFYLNLGQIDNMANDILQLDVYYFLYDAWRFAINSTIGLAGLIDWAKDMGLPHRTQDFGLTMARWGWHESTYFFIPVLGPSTLRDGLGLLVDYFVLGGFNFIRPTLLRVAMTVFNYISLRAELLDNEELFDQVAIDPYVFYRNAYLQYRRNLIHQRYGGEDKNDPFVAGDDSDYFVGDDTNTVNHDKPSTAKTS